MHRCYTLCMHNNPLPQGNNKNRGQVEKSKGTRGANRAMTNVRITLTIQPGLLDIVDEAAEKDFTTRSDIIRTALLWYLRPVGGRPQEYGEEQEELYTLLRQRRARASFHKEREQLKKMLEEPEELID